MRVAEGFDTQTDLQTLLIIPHMRQLGIHKQVSPESKTLKV